MTSAVTMTENVEDTLIEATQQFGLQTSKVLNAMHGVSTASATGPNIGSFKATEGELSVSVLFIGTTFGEFILSFSKEAVAGLSKEFGDDQAALEEALSEVINMVSGFCMRFIGDSCEKMTITAPRVIRGHLKLPKVKTGLVSVSTSVGRVDCLLYVDQMRLDIASSYRQVISNLSKTNEELASVNQKLKDQQTQLVQSEKMASLGMMAAGVAHEINNPLAFVMGNIEVLEGYIRAMTNLLGGYEKLCGLVFENSNSQLGNKIAEIKKFKDEEDMEFILKDTSALMSQSRNGLDRIKSIVSGLKRFSRMDHDTSGAANVNEEIENLLILIQPKIKKKNCAIEKDLKSADEIACSPVQIGQVLLNLISNAIDALPDQGGVVKVATESKDGWVSISVADNGSGISPEHVDKLFTPFFTTKPVGVGTGLGLAISYGIIKGHQGTIDVHTEIGKGTCFTVKFPVRAAEALKCAA